MSAAEHLGFPVYGIAFDPHKQRLVAVGGGGSSKTGVKNFINLYKINFKRVQLKKLGQVSTGIEAPMNVCVNPKSPDAILCGVNDRCWSLSIEETSDSKEKIIPLPTDNDDDVACSIALMKSFQTDFAPSDGYQKVVRFSSRGDRFATGGADGHFRVWSFPGMKKQLDIASSGKEEILDVAFKGSRAAFLTAKAFAIVSIANGSVVKHIEAKPDFSFRAFEFIDSQLVVMENSRDRRASNMLLFDAETFCPVKHVKLRSLKALTALSKSADDKHLGVGCADGSVGILDFPSLSESLCRKSYHGFAVTSIQLAKQPNTSTYFLISGSADGSVKVLRWPGRSSTSLLLKVLLFLLTIAIVVLAFLAQNNAELLKSLESFVRKHVVNKLM